MLMLIPISHSFSLVWKTFIFSAIRTVLSFESFFEDVFRLNVKQKRGEVTSLSYTSEDFLCFCNFQYKFTIQFFWSISSRISILINLWCCTVLITFRNLFLNLVILFVVDRISFIPILFGYMVWGFLCWESIPIY